MNEQRKILEMLSEGSITVEEAYRLLEAVKDDNKGELLSKRVKEKIADSKKKIEDAMKKLNHKLENIGDKVSAAVKKVHVMDSEQTDNTEDTEENDQDE